MTRVGRKLPVDLGRSACKLPAVLHRSVQDVAEVEALRKFCTAIASHSPSGGPRPRAGAEAKKPQNKRAARGGGRRGEEDGEDKRKTLRPP